MYSVGNEPAEPPTSTCFVQSEGFENYQQRIFWGAVKFSSGSFASATACRLIIYDSPARETLRNQSCSDNLIGVFEDAANVNMKKSIYRGDV